MLNESLLQEIASVEELEAIFQAELAGAAQPPADLVARLLRRMILSCRNARAQEAADAPNG